MRLIDKHIYFSKQIQVEMFMTEENALLTMYSDLDHEILPVGERGIIFCLEKRDVRDIVDHLGPAKSKPFYSGLSGDEEKRNFSDWSNGHCHWLVSTSALGAGVHVKGVTRVYIFLGAFNLFDLVQQMGRASTQGFTSVRIFTSASAKSRRGMSVHDNKHYWNWVETNQCRVRFLGAFMDGKGLNGSDHTPSCFESTRSQLTFCDNCVKTIKGMTPIDN